MANFPAYRHTDTGDTVYGVIRNAAGQHWDVFATSFETLVPGSWTDYDIVATETPASGYQYIITIPATVTSGVVYLDLYLQAAGVAAITDTLLATISYYWDSTTVHEIPSSILSNTVDGVTVSDALISIMAVLFGDASVDIVAKTIEFKQRDGSTTQITVTHDNAGNRSNSTIT